LSPLFFPWWFFYSKNGIFFSLTNPLPRTPTNPPPTLAPPQRPFGTQGFPPLDPKGWFHGGAGSPLFTFFSHQMFWKPLLCFHTCWFSGALSTKNVFLGYVFWFLRDHPISLQNVGLFTPPPRVSIFPPTVVSFASLFQGQTNLGVAFPPSRFHHVFFFFSMSGSFSPPFCWQNCPHFFLLTNLPPPVSPPPVFFIGYKSTHPLPPQNTSGFVLPQFITPFPPPWLCFHKVFFLFFSCFLPKVCDVDTVFRVAPHNF